MKKSLTAICATAIAALVMVAIAGCGGSDAPATDTAAAGGGPASSAQNWMTADAFQTVSSYPSTPVCDPGGLGDEDEETCQHFWNHMLAWQTLTDEVKGPRLDGAGSGSMLYGGFRGELNDTQYWGPNLPSGCEGTGSIGPNNPNYCKDKSPGLGFGKTTNIETFDSGSETKSTITWRLKPGDVNFGDEFFTAYNDGGEGGTQWAFCSKRSSARSSGEWVSCSRANDPDADGATVNTTQPTGNNEDYASFGWVVEDYPVLVRIANRLPDSRFRIESASGQDIAFSAQGSTKGALSGDAQVFGPSSPVLEVKVIGKGKVVTTPDTSGPTINCGAGASTCKQSVEAGTTVNLTAEPSTGNAFSAWSNEECASGGAACEFQMPEANRTVCATFTPDGDASAPSGGDPTCTAAPEATTPAEKSLWVAGYRKRTGEGRLQITGTLYGTTKSSEQSAFHDAPVTITALFAQGGKAPSCTVSSTSKPGTNAKCSVSSFQAGGRSAPGVLQVFIQQGSAS